MRLSGWWVVIIFAVALAIDGVIMMLVLTATANLGR